MSSFFISRPIFAWVLAVLVMLAGSLAFITLPVAQFPEIASPQVVVTAKFPGASAATMESTVTQIIEQQISGIDNLIYMSSNSDSTGTSQITFTFENGTNVDIAQVQVQNKLQLAMPMLPEEVQRQGVSVTKSSVGVLLIMGLTSSSGMTGENLSDYLRSHLKDPLSRIAGIGEIMTIGAQYAMRVWCDPTKFEQYALNPADVVAAIQEQNDQTKGGQTGAYPLVAGQEINLTVNASSRLERVEQFENIILRTKADGSMLRLRDVARVELNGETFNFIIRNNGEPSVGALFMLAPGANALKTGDAVKKQMKSYSAFFPPGMDYVYTYDTIPFIEISIQEVFKTLGEAIVLVFLVMYLFLQKFRATFIPTIAIPVVMLGTFGVLAAAGYSINTLTMFGMVLAIGLLVDDAIVVVENVERLMREENLSPVAAARRSMTQISGALVGVAMVIAAVFVPMAFMPGSVGILYRQFSLTIVTAMAMSALVALILSPALCATLLKTGYSGKQGFFDRFNHWFERISGSYQQQVARMLHRPRFVFITFGLALLLVGWLFFHLPTSFVPNEDQGAFYAIAQLPPGATMERTDAVLAEIRDYLLTEEKLSIRNVQTMAGYSFIGSGQNVGQAFISLRHWDERTKAEQHVDALIARTRRRFSDTPEARVTVFGPAPIKEMARASGFEFELMDLTGRGHDALMEARNILLDKARRQPALRNVRHGGLDDVEQYDLQIDLEKAEALSLRKGDINDAVAAYWGGVYVNDFMDRGRTKKVYLQADADFRMQVSDFDRYHVRNAYGKMVPFPSFLTVTNSKGSPLLERYQGVPAIKILGEAAPGRSSGEAMAAMEDLAAGLPEGFGFQWTGLSYQERQTGAQVGFLYALSLVVVFLCLAALYESWTIPLSVLLVMPSGVLGATLGVFLRDMNNDVYFHIGMLAVMGLSAKNSILIVEFAREMHKKGENLFTAVEKAVRIRLRPIIMTSLTFVLGVLPLALNSGAGSGSQNAVGTTVVCGVISATVLGIYLTPLFFVAVTSLFARK
ncbi:MAG: efflux RND transporter permease subunit [Desulfovibrio sp.]|jgi:hydrophobe/amphiphile efflux-1 (HAE1) family protein|nr:efflux RND transporter permease subunit [Desulfovibrio sp.]